MTSFGRTIYIHFPVLLALCLGCSAGAHGQKSRVMHLLAEHHFGITELNKEAVPGKQKIFLETGFGQSTILNPTEIAHLESAVIEKVELVYTAYAELPDFDQNGLNAERVANLEALLPKMCRDFLVEWNTLGITDLENRSTALRQFHGFVITFRAPYDEKAALDEITLLEATLTGDVTVETLFPSDYSSSLTPISDGSESTNESTSVVPESSNPYTSMDLTSLNEVNLKLVENILKLPIPKDSTVKDFTEKFVIEEGSWMSEGTVQMTYESTIQITNGVPEPCAVRVWKDRAGKITSTTKIWLLKGGDIEMTSQPGSVDTVVFAVFHRNDWTGMALACDVTGSMAMYTAQTFLWMKDSVEQGRVNYIVFFNDGDRKLDKRKKIGNTGGLYGTPAKVFENVHKTGLQSIRNGSGGDIPENNIEAVLEAIEQCPTCSEVVLVADNKAEPRDMELLEKVDRPVRVISCGVGRCLSVHYLNIAYKTGGSVHLMEHDITNLSSYEEGDNLTIGDIEYRVARGQFEYVLPDDY
jgi:hypothetical protein